MKSIGSEEFFKEVAATAGIMDTRVVKDVFYSMIRVISRQLKSRHIVRLPDWGDFKLSIYKARRIKDVNSGSLRDIGAKALVRFIPDRKVKHYFYAFGADQGEGTMLK